MALTKKKQIFLKKRLEEFERNIESGKKYSRQDLLELKLKRSLEDLKHGRIKEWTN